MGAISVHVSWIRQSLIDMGTYRRPSLRCSDAASSIRHTATDASKGAMHCAGRTEAHNTNPANASRATVWRKCP